MRLAQGPHQGSQESPDLTPLGGTVPAIAGFLIAPNPRRYDARFGCLRLRCEIHNTNGNGITYCRCISISGKQNGEKTKERKEKKVGEKWKSQKKTKIEELKGNRGPKCIHNERGLTYSWALGQELGSRASPSGVSIQRRYWYGLPFSDSAMAQERKEHTKKRGENKVKRGG